MRKHRTTQAHETRPVLFRHAKCKNCDHRFKYHLSAAPDTQSTRPVCPDCGEQGIGGPFGRTNPAEWVGLIQELADGTAYDYADWLAGDAALYKPAVRPDNHDRFVFVGEAKDYLPCRVTVHRDARGIGSTGFSPSVYARWLANGAEMTLVGVEEVPDRKRPGW